VNEKSGVLVEALFSDLDRRDLIPLAEVAKKLGYSQDQVRNYAKNGTIPGGRQAGPGKRWVFKRVPLEKWWQDFNTLKPEEAKWR
jgi:hypothetical protein